MEIRAEGLGFRVRALGFGAFVGFFWRFRLYRD